MFITPAELAEHRADAESRMESAITIRRKTGQMVSQDNGLEVPEWVVVQAGVPFRLGGSDSGDSSSRRVDIGGVEVQVAVRVGHLPVTIDGLADGDFIEVVTGENAGTVWRIVEVAFKDQATARRVPLLAEDRPEEWP